MATNEEFLSTIKEGCIQGWREHAVLASISGAQAILESNWGKSTLALKANNLFGIKGDYNGESLTVETKEFIDKAIKTVDATFRKYQSWAESITDHSAFFTSTDWRRTNYAAVVGETDYKKAAAALSAAGYATDPDYPAKLIKLIETHDLQQWDLQEEETTMTKLIVLGHGNGDPGASGNGTTEASWLRGEFLTSLKKYAAQVGGIDFYESNMFADRTASTISGYDNVTELHLDAAAASASGGHVIVKSGMGTDATDENLCNVVRNNFGLVAYTQSERGFSYRDDLLNLNVFATRGISYRLVELCFITNSKDMNYFFVNYDKVAKEIIEAVSGVSITSAPTVTVTAAEVVYAGPVRNPVSYNAVVTSGGYSIDSKPWGEDGAEYWGSTDDQVGKVFYFYEENYSGEYANGMGLGWVDKRALEKEKVVVASALYLPNGQNWVVYPEEGPYEVGEVISVEGKEGSWYTILGDKGNNIVIIELQTLGRKAIYFDKDKGATITQKFA